jgi:DNA modification methylase
LTLLLCGENVSGSSGHEDAGWRIIHGDCVLALPRLTERPRLIFADPSYNIGVDYGDGPAADRLPDDVFVAWCRSWIEQVHRVLADDGTFWLLINHEYADYLGVELRKAGFHRRATVTWYETFGVCNSARTNFSRCSRPLFYSVKDPRRFAWNPEPLLVQSARQEKYNDRRASPDGKMMDDVWVIPRVAGTFKERIRGFPNQLPLELLRWIVLGTSAPGDLVVDPFCGSATTGVAAIQAGRRYIGIAKQAHFAELAAERLRTATSPAREQAVMFNCDHCRRPTDTPFARCIACGKENP